MAPSNPDINRAQLTRAQQFHADPRVTQAKQLLFDALAEAHQAISQVQPPNPQLAQAYQQQLDRFANTRGAGLYYPYLGSGIGQGALVELADGSIKYDMINGIGVHVAGHGSQAMLNAALDAALSDTVMQGNLQQNVESEKLAQTFTQLACKQGSILTHCLLTTSGAMANENAFKMIFQKHHPAWRWLAFERCFMGRTLAMAQVTDKHAYRQGLPATLHVDYIPFFDPDNLQQSTQQAVGTLKNKLARYPSQYAGMSFELIQGEGGYYPGQHDFFAALMDVLKENNVAIHIDEVQTFGRTTEPFAFQHFQLDAYVDVVTVGKMTQVCATLFGDRHVPQPGLISQTFTGSTSAILAAQTIIDTLTTQNFFGAGGRIAQIHQRFVKHFDAMPQVTGPFGLGGMIAFAVFDGSKDKSVAFIKALYANGVIAFIAGHDPTRVRLLPPLMCITDHDIDEVVQIIEQTLIAEAG